MGPFVFPPRGLDKTPHPAAPPSAVWAHPSSLGPDWDWKPGMTLLGKWGNRLIGRGDDRHVVTLAGSRTGKTATVLIPNLLRYPGPVVVIDPKGELARATAKKRAAFGPVHILDPFGVSGFASSSHNPFDELRTSSLPAADAGQIADALIVDAGSKDSHWTDSAKNLIKGLVLHLLSSAPEQANMRGVRRLLNEVPPVLIETFKAMAYSPAYDGTLANIGRAFYSMVEFGQNGPTGFTNEMKSILSTARQQTAPLDDVAAICDQSAFWLSEIGSKNLSVFLVLPGMRIGSHYRWLRLFIMQALAAMEMNPIPRDRLPAWFVLEEFAALGRVQAIETAAGYMAGYGVKLWAVLQDLTQLKTHYAQGWETFLGNAGVIQAFGNVDLTTTRALSDLLGQTQYMHIERVPTSSSAMQRGDVGMRENLRAAPLLAPSEVTLAFSRETGRQLVIVPGEPPIFLERLPFS